MINCYNYWQKASEQDITWKLPRTTASWSSPPLCGGGNAGNQDYCILVQSPLCGGGNAGNQDHCILVQSTTLWGGNAGNQDHCILVQSGEEMLVTRTTASWSSPPLCGGGNAGNQDHCILVQSTTLWGGNAGNQDHCILVQSGEEMLVTRPTASWSSPPLCGEETLANRPTASWSGPPLCGRKRWQTGPLHPGPVHHSVGGNAGKQAHCILVRSTTLWGGNAGKQAHCILVRSTTLWEETLVTRTTASWSSPGRKCW